MYMTSIMPNQQIKQVYSTVTLLRNNIVCKQFNSLKKFKNELEFLEELQDLDMVVKLLDYNEKEKKIYIEYIPYSLEKIIMEKKLNYTQKIHIIKQICKYIIDSHEIGIVHNDLKSKNILLTQDYTVKIIDYDLASWNTDPLRDIKQFKFIIIQLLFNINYKNSYTKFDDYVEKVQEDLCDIFYTNDIYEIDNILDSIILFG